MTVDGGGNNNNNINGVNSDRWIEASGECGLEQKFKARTAENGHWIIMFADGMIDFVRFVSII